MLVNVKWDISAHKRIHFKVADFICLLNFEWRSLNEVGNIGIVVLTRVCEKPDCYYNARNGSGNRQRNHNSANRRCWLGFSFLPAATSCGQGYVFIRVCHSVNMGGVCLSACWDTIPPEQTPAGSRPHLGANTPPGNRHSPPPGSRLRNTVNERPVCILLECILVQKYKFSPLDTSQKIFRNAQLV